MDIERLKEDIRNVEYDLECGEEQNQGRIAVDVNCLRSVIDFTNEAIARQSVKSEEVADAIKDLTMLSNVWQEIGQPTKELDIAITALQAYQPTTRKNRIVEEVAISQTETTSARALSCWYCTEIEKHGVVAVKTVLDKAGRKLDAYETPCNYCPNCGRRLED